jgi:hypothetical protein
MGQLEYAIHLPVGEPAVGASDCCCRRRFFSAPLVYARITMLLVAGTGGVHCQWPYAKASGNAWWARIRSINYNCHW